MEDHGVLCSGCLHALPCPLQIRMAPAEKPSASLGAGGLRALTWHLAEARGVPGNSGTLVR